MEKLSKNLIWMAATNVVSSILGAATLIYLARTLMPAALGNLSYVMTLVVYMGSFIDLGLSTYGIREVAKNRAQASEYVSNIVSFRCVIAAIISVPFIAVAIFSHQSYLLKVLMAEAGLLLFMSAFMTEWAFQGMEKMHMVFISFLVTGTLQLIFMVSLVKGPQDLLKAPTAYLFGASPIILIFLKALKVRFRIRAVDFRSIKAYLLSSVVIWAISVFAQVYNSLDVFMLGLFRTAEEVGFFTIARRFTSGITLLAVFLANALLPRLSSTFKTDNAQFKRATGKFLAVAAALAIFLLLPIMIFGADLIKFVVGQGYLPARLPLNIMIVGLVLILFNLPYSTGLIAASMEKEVLKQVIASAVLSVSLNLILMPRYGMVGAAVSFVCAEALALAWILRVYRVKIRS